MLHSLLKFWEDVFNRKPFNNYDSSQRLLWNGFCNEFRMRAETAERPCQFTHPTHL